MIGAMRTWWLGLSRREQTLIGIAAALAVPLFAWFAVIMPLSDAMASARERHRQAVDRHAAIIARATLADALKDREADQPRANGRVDLVIGQSAAEHGFTLSRNDAAGEDAASIAIGSARAAALFAWIGELETRGLMARDLSIRPNANGTVTMTATFRRAR